MHCCKIGKSPQTQLKPTSRKISFSKISNFLVTHSYSNDFIHCKHECDVVGEICARQWHCRALCETATKRLSNWHGCYSPARFREVCVYDEFRMDILHCGTLPASENEKNTWSNARSITLHWRQITRDGVSNHQPHYCFINRLFKAQIKENIKALRHWPLWGEFTGNRWIPRTKDQ